MTATFTTSAPVADHRGDERLEVGGHPGEVVVRKHDAPAVPLADPVVEPVAPLEVDELRAQVEGLRAESGGAPPRSR